MAPAFVRASIRAVVQTLFEAILLVVIVVVVFLQTWRASIIPLAAVPVSLVGTFAVLLGLGFSLSGTGTHPSFFGPFTSPRTHGNYGAGSTLFWIDPQRDMTFVCLTAGVMDEGDNVLRFQKLSTIAASAVL